MDRERLDLRTAGHGVYAVRSSSRTVYLVKVSDVPEIMRVYGGHGSPPFEGDGAWWPLIDVVSGPPVGAVGPVRREDFAPWVVRVGSRTKYAYDIGRPDVYQWAIGRTVERIDGPLSDEQIDAIAGAASVQGTVEGR